MVFSFVCDGWLIAQVILPEFRANVHPYACKLRLTEWGDFDKLIAECAYECTHFDPEEVKRHDIPCYCPRARHPVWLARQPIRWLGALAAALPVLALTPGVAQAQSGNLCRESGRHPRRHRPEPQHDRKCICCVSTALPIPTSFALGKRSSCRWAFNREQVQAAS